MNNNILIKVEGRNIYNYLKWLIKNGINIYKLNIVSSKELNIVINYRDFDKASKYSKTYSVTIVKKYGKLKIITFFKSNIVILLSVALSIAAIYFLSNIIFSIDIIYNDQKIVKLLVQELEKNGIKKYHFKKDYNYLNKVKEKILKDNSNILEWLEIEEMGTKYIVRLVERVKEEDVKEYKYQSVVARKNAVITSILASSGEKVKNINSYVRQGEIIISGVLTKPDGTNIYEKAQGKVYGEIWYKTTIEYPLYYQEESVTGKSKNTISLLFLNRKISLFPYKKYKQFKTSSNPLIINNYLPIGIVKDKMYEVHIEEDIYTVEEAIVKAKNIVSQKIKDSNNNIITINDIQILQKELANNKINLELFISVTEDITDYLELHPEIDNNQN